MSSLMKKHKQRALEKYLGKEKKIPEALRQAREKLSRVSQSEHEVVEHVLQKDLDTLKKFDEIEEKIEYKKNVLIPRYLPKIEAYIESGDSYDFPLLVYMAMWLIDAESIEKGLAIASVAIDQEQSLPEYFNRDLPTFVAEEICKWAKKQYADDASASPYIDEVAAKLVDNEWEVENIVVLNSIYKLMGEYADRGKEFGDAVFWYEKCVEVNPEKHGVKGKLQKAKENLNAE